MPGIGKSQMSPLAKVRGAESSKLSDFEHSFTFVFDRVKGKPVWPIDERLEDTTTGVPGEALYPTRALPAKPPRFSRQVLSIEGSIHLTPELHALAVDDVQRFRLGPLFTPPSRQWTLQGRGAGCGANWGGAAFAPETGLLSVRTSKEADTNQVCVNAGNDHEIDAACSNDCPYRPTLIKHREASGPRTAQTPESKLGTIPVITPPYEPGGDRPECEPDRMGSAIRRG